MLTPFICGIPPTLGVTVPLIPDPSVFFMYSETASLSAFV